MIRSPAYWDWPLLVCALALCILGLVNIDSATATQGISAETWRQMISMLVGVGVMLLVSRLDLLVFFRHSGWLYFLLLALLGSVALFGVTVNGAKRWIELGGGISFQPSEIAKLLLVFWMARQLTGGVEGSSQGIKPTFHNFSLLYLLLGVPTLLIMLQPDLGTAIVFAGVGTAMMWCAGFNWRWFACLIGGALALLPWGLHDYQRQRIMVFLAPESDPTGAGWNIIQSKIAIGAGGLWGQGWRLGTQNRLDFVPEHHTDFIFTVLGEEMGFIGFICLLLLLMGLIARAFTLAWRADNTYDAYSALGVGTLLALHAGVNLRTPRGPLPVARPPLPFISYGGTSLVVNFAALGILLNIARRIPRL